MEFDVNILKLPDKNSTAIKITTNNGKTFSTIIQNRNFEDETKALISQTVFKLVYNLAMKDLVMEKLEEKGYEYIKRNGRPRSLNVKNVFTEEQREKNRKSALKCYYKRKSITAN